jgi:hypothetical protein
MVCDKVLVKDGVGGEVQRRRRRRRTTRAMQI